MQAPVMEYREPPVSEQARPGPGLAEGMTVAHVFLASATSGYLSGEALTLAGGMPTP